MKNKEFGHFLPQLKISQRKDLKKEKVIVLC